ncbi:MAG TPA: tRNA (guanosine(46)-N7)-methyltransferase TrmB [Prolixibacteraceae bacterium]|nr:tRNA (guanosine(46)-N7)-methyltransferase TrmB [Prolixibacteraceae bacterium]
MGKNKLARFAEMAEFENVFQPDYDAIRENGFSLKNRWAEHYFRNQAPITLELGCGKGEYTVGLAERYPDRNFIGIDIKGARIYTGARDALQKNLKNVAFVRTKIENAELLFGPGEIAEIWLTFPDPQMKKERKRLTSSWFLERYRKFLSENAVIRLKTDSGFQYSYTRALAQQNNFRIINDCADLYATPLPDDLPAITTFYEKQWRERGMSIKYLAFSPGKEGIILEPEGEFEKDNYRSYGRKAFS